MVIVPVYAVGAQEQKVSTRKWVGHGGVRRRRAARKAGTRVAQRRLFVRVAIRGELRLCLSLFLFLLFLSSLHIVERRRLDHDDTPVGARRGGRDEPFRARVKVSIDLQRGRQRRYPLPLGLVACGAAAAGCRAASCAALHEGAQKEGEEEMLSHKIDVGRHKPRRVDANTRRRVLSLPLHIRKHKVASHAFPVSRR